MTGFVLHGLWFMVFNMYDSFKMLGLLLGSHSHRDPCRCIIYIYIYTYT